MLCPESYHVQNNKSPKENEKLWQNTTTKMPVEGTGSLELNSYKNIKTWKKSITNFFRFQHRRTKSNDGDQRSSEIQKQIEEKEITTEQKWESLGKVFRRQSFDYWSKSPSQQGESSTSSKRFAVKKVLSSYFGKKPSTFANDK